MPIQVSYMGTKRQIAPLVADVIAAAPDGPLLDLFSGVCAVGAAVAPSRQLWCNDIQRFASTVAAAFFTSKRPPIAFDEIADRARPFFADNKSALEACYALELEAERRAFESADLKQLSGLADKLPNVASSPQLEAERARLADNRREFPYRLFCITFSGGYLGLEQSIQVDAIRYAVDRLRDDGKLDGEQHRWMCLALCQAVSKVSSTTGHFAQFMTVKENNKRRFLAQRRRSIWREWLSAIYYFVPVGGTNWRGNNRVFNNDACALLDKLRKSGTPPAVVYADPPYTDDQYSRYYHLYETLLLYDYPTSTGVGRYRPDRVVSKFSSKTFVHSAIEDLITRCSRLGSHLVLSYPENGLLKNSREVITSTLGERFSKNEIARTVDHFHSSLGGSKGAEKYPVKEIIYAAG